MNDWFKTNKLNPQAAARVAGRIVLGCATVLVCLSQAIAADEKVTFDDHIKPIFRQRCASCHNGDRKSGGLDVTNFTNLMQGGSSGTVVRAGDASDSYLYQLVTHEEDPIMPPNSDPIPQAEQNLIQKWIDEGALENQASVSTVAKKPSFEMTGGGDAATRPAEPIPMARLLLQPVKTSPRATNINAIACNPWKPLVAISSLEQIVLYDTAAGKIVGILPFPEGQVESMRFSRDGRLLVAGGGRGGALGIAVVWDLSTGERIAKVGDELDSVLAVDISSDYQKIALGGPQKVVKVFETGSGELLYEARKHTEWVTDLEFSPDGVLLASADRNGGLVLWEADTGREYLTLGGHGKAITSLSWRIDSNVLASASEDTGIRLWEVVNGSQIKTWGAHGGGVGGIQFTRDGRIVSCGRDRVPKIWKQDGTQEKPLPATNDISTAAAYCHETDSVIVGDWRGNVLAFNVAEATLRFQLAMNPPTIEQRLRSATQALDSSKQLFAPVDTQLTANLAELESLRGRLQELQASLGEIASAVTATTADLQAAKTKLAELDSQEKERASKLKTLQAALPLVQESLEKAKLALQSIGDDAQLNQVVEQLKTRVQQMTERAAALQSQQTNSVADRKNQQQLVAATQAKLQELGEQNQTASQSLAEVQQTLQATEQKNKALVAEHEKLAQAVQQCSQELKRWQDERAFITAYQELQEQIANSTQSQQESAQVVAQKTEQLNTAQQALEAARNVAQQRAAELAALQARMRQLKQLDGTNN